MWILLDNVKPNNPYLINLDRVDDISWSSGTLTFDYTNGAVEIECSKDEFIKIAQKLDILQEIE